MYANQPSGTLGQPIWRSVQVVDGIAYVHAEESYTISHGNGEGYRFDSIYALNDSTGYRIWTFTDPERFSDPTIVDGVVYANDGQNLCALDASTGVTRWNYSVQGSIAWYTPPTEQMVCVGVGGAPFSDSTCYVAALDQVTGEEVWRHEFGWNYNFVQPTVGAGALYFGVEDHYYAYNLKDGEQIWAIPVSTFSGVGGDDFAKFANGNIYFTTGKMMYAINAASGNQLWAFTSEGYAAQGQSSFVISDRCLFVVEYKAIFTAPNIFALDISNGHKLWNHSISGYWIVESPAAIGGIFHFGESIQHFYGLNASNGQQLWTHGNALPVISDRVIYYYNASNHVLEACNPINGGDVWVSPSLPYSWFIGVQEGVAFFGQDSYFYAVNIPAVNLPEPSQTPTPTTTLTTMPELGIGSQISGSLPFILFAVIIIIAAALVVKLFRKKASTSKE